MLLLLLPVVDVDDGEHEPLARLELVLDAVLEPLALDLHGGEDEAVAHEVRRVADALGRLEAVEVRLLALDVDGVERVEAEPRREGEPVLVGQLRNGRQDDGLKSGVRATR